MTKQKKSKQPAVPLIVLGDLGEQKAELTHGLTGTQFNVFFREPTTEERVAYSNSILVSRGRKMKVDTATARLRGGLKILTGVEDGVLGVPDGKGGVKAISTNPDGPNYEPEWKNLAKKYLGQEIMLLGAAVFERSTILMDEVEDDPDDLELDGEVPNSLKTSKQ